LLNIFPTKIRENKKNKEDSILMVPESSNQNILEKQIKANASRYGYGAY
jgi:hypothetical protein